MAPRNMSWRQIIFILVVLVIFSAIASKLFFLIRQDKRSIVVKILDTSPSPKMVAQRTPAQRRAAISKMCNVYKPDSVPQSFYKARLNYSRGSSTLFVHGTYDIVSNDVIRLGIWEAPAISEMEKVFDVDPSLGLIDVGCNVGVYTMVAAMRGRKVVAVDVNIENMKRVRKSVLENKVTHRVTLVYNGISDRRMKFSIRTPIRSNIGDTFMVSAKKNDRQLVSSILMDDLLEVIDFNRAIMKIDIQGHEFDGFHHADKLFTEVDIPIVMMEWVLIGPHRDQKIPLYIIGFFRRHNYLAYATIFSRAPLPWKSFKKWPYDIVWKKNVL